MHYVYMDYAATTPLDQRVLLVMEKFHIEYFGNPSSLHPFGERAEEGLQKARRIVLTRFGATGGKIVFTGGGTEANNLALKGIASAYRDNGKHIIVSSIEHDSVLNTCAELEAEGFRITRLPVDAYGRISVDDVKHALCQDTILVSVMHANNEVGTIQPVEDIADFLANDRSNRQKATPLFHCDATQTVGKLNINLSRWKVDAMTFSAHKFYGPKGVGGLFLGKRVQPVPLISGGGQEYNLRSGTQNVPGIVGCAYALDLIHREMESLEKKYVRWNKQIRSALENLEGAFLTVPFEYAIPTHIHFRIQHVEGQAIAQELGRKGIAASTSSACHARYWQPSHVTRAMGYTEQESREGVRITLGRQLTDDDISYFIVAIKEIHNRFQKQHASVRV